MSTTDSVTATTRVEVPPGVAFELFTEQVDAWWKHGARFRPAVHEAGTLCFEPRAGGRFLETYPRGDAFELGWVRIWEPGTRLVFGMGGRDFASDESTEVEVCFEAEGRGTRVTVTHRGWDALRPGHPARHGLDGPAFADVMGVWWADLLNASRRHAAAMELPPRRGL